MRQRLPVVTFAFLLLLMSSAVWATAPEGVSPGAAEGVALSEQRCPTFSWTVVEGARGYELVVYSLPGPLEGPVAVDPAQATEVLAQRLPGGATSWTPPCAACFAPQVRHAWFVRAVLAEEAGEVTEASGWSAAKYFAVAGALTLGQELAEAGQSGARSERGARGREAAVGSAVAERPAAPAGGAKDRTVPTALAAVKGASPDTVGEVYGVVGTTASAAGGGVAAANTAGGPDLVLDGSAQGLADTFLSESGIDRPSASAQTFTVGNSGGGGMSLQVSGAIAGDGSLLSNLNASSLASGTLPNLRLFGTYSRALTFSNTSNSYAGDGSLLTNLSASSLATGTLADALLSGTYSQALTFSNTSDSYAGNGSQLTNLNAGNLSSGVLPGQRLFGTYGRALTFTNAANSFTGSTLTLGTFLYLPATAASGGVPSAGALYLGSDPFLHGYGTGNTFLGPNAGNFTMTGSLNTASGAASLNQNTSGFENTASGVESLHSNTTGTYNLATGNGSLYANTSGSENTAVGYQSLFLNTTAGENTAVGYQALYSQSYDPGTAWDSENTAVGSQALYSDHPTSWLDGKLNTAVGTNSLYSNTTGSYNTAIGADSLHNNMTGHDNIALGDEAGYNTTGTDNIDIGNPGYAGEDETIRIGYSHDKTFIAGIRGVTTGQADAVPVLIDSYGQLGTVSSSIRFKRDVQDMGEASSRLLELRPVTFHYKAQPDGPLQYGLIAEEVEKVLPELVVRDATGQVETVAYHEMPAMLLNELQKQQATIQAQQARAEAQDARIAAQQVRIEAQQAQIEELRRTVQALLDERGSSRGR